MKRTKKPPKLIIYRGYRRFLYGIGASFNGFQLENVQFRRKHLRHSNRHAMTNISLILTIVLRLMLFVTDNYTILKKSNVNAVGLRDRSSSMKCIGIQKGLQSCPKFESYRIIQWLIIGSTEWRGMRHNSLCSLSVCFFQLLTSKFIH